MRKISRLAALLLAALILTPGTAFAHAEVERAEPAAGAEMDAAPAEVRVWFTQELFRREGENRLAVFDAAGNQVDNGDARIDDDDRTLMVATLRAGLGAGVYTVRVRSLSVDDGHPWEGEFTFTVRAAVTDSAPETPTTVPTAPAAPAATATPVPAPTLTTPVPSRRGVACFGMALLFAPLGLVLWRRNRHA